MTAFVFFLLGALWAYAMFLSGHPFTSLFILAVAVFLGWRMENK